MRYCRRPFIRVFFLMWQSRLVRTLKIFEPSDGPKCACGVTGRVTPVVPTVAVWPGSRVALAIMLPCLDPHLTTICPTTPRLTPRRRQHLLMPRAMCLTPLHTCSSYRHKPFRYRQPLLHIPYPHLTVTLHKVFLPVQSEIRVHPVVTLAAAPVSSRRRN